MKKTQQIPPFVPNKDQKTPEEHLMEKHYVCPNCRAPMVIRDKLWVCFTCAHECPVF